MSTSTATQAVFAGTVQKTNGWLREVMEEMHWDDPHRAYVGLRATLHALRDRLTTQETAQLSAQLPMLLRGIWYEGWKPRAKPLPIRHVDEFYDQVRKELRRDTGVPIPNLVRAVFRVLSNHVSEGEINDIVSILPTELRELWPEHVLR